MGCDIHAAIEYSLDGAGYFTLCKDFDIERDYKLFSALAGVRGDLSPLYSSRT